jgi:hypothetical protein
LSEIVDCVGSRKEIEEWTSVPIGSPWERMKPLGLHTTTERTIRRQEREFRMVLKTGDFSGLGKNKDKL